jgi:GTPase SAR1 family protein
VPEIKQYCESVPFLIVGTKIDLRDDEATLEKLFKKKQKPITTEQGQAIAKKVGAFK